MVTQLATIQPQTARSTAGIATFNPAWVVALAGVAFFMVSLDLLVVTTALPAIRRDLGSSVAVLGWVINIYTLAAAGGIVTAAALGDRFGRRRVFTFGLALFTAASASCALAPSIGWLLAARAVQGLGGAIMAPLSVTLLATAFPPERRGAMIGILGGLSGLAIAAGPLVGGVVTQGIDWHWIFWINVPVGILATLFARTRLPESRGPVTRLDLPAAALISSGAVSLIWALMRGNDLGWTSPAIVAALTAGVLLVAAFVIWERQAQAPMLPLHLFANRAFAAACATAFMMTAALIAMPFTFAQYLQIALGYGPLDAGLRFLPMTATPLIVAPLAGALSDRIGQRPLIVFGLLLYAGSLSWLAHVVSTGSGYAAEIVPLVLAGTGIAMPFATVTTAALNAVAPADLGKASGAINTLQRFGGAFGVAVATAVFTAQESVTGPASFASGLPLSLVAAAGLALLGACTALVIGTRHAHVS